MADESKKSSLWTWVAVGCGGFILLAIVLSCVGPGLFTMMMMDSFGSSMPMPATPPGSTGGGTAGLELPPPPGPLMPVGTAGSVNEVSKTFTLVVTEVEGFDEIAVGDECPFEVQRLPRGAGGYWCRTEVRCGDITLYGGPGQGYFDCTFPDDPYQHLEAYDYGMQDDDGDASFNINYDGVITIRNLVAGENTAVIGELRDGGTVPVRPPGDEEAGAQVVDAPAADGETEP